MNDHEKKIQTTLGELAAVALAPDGRESALAHALKLPNLSEKTKYTLAKLTRLVEAETKHWADRRNALAKELAGDADRVPPDKIAEFNTRMEEINAVPVTIAWRPVTSVELAGALASDWLALGPLCELVEP